MSTLKVFLSHASEDKEDLVRSLADALATLGLNVWYDEYSLKIGDSLRQSIDRGIAECDAGIVVLSSAFFSKSWPQAELNALFNSELAGANLLIPIWHKIDIDELRSYSPLLVDRVAIKSTGNVPQIALSIANHLGVSGKHTCKELAEILRAILLPNNSYASDARAAGPAYRFAQLHAAEMEFDEFLTDLSYADDDEPIPDMFAVRESIRKAHQLPESKVSDYFLPPSDGDIKHYSKRIDAWALSKLDRKHSQKLLHDFDNELGVDKYYILIGRTWDEISDRQRPLVDSILVEAGCKGIGQTYELIDQLEKLDEAGLNPSINNRGQTNA